MIIKISGKSAHLDHKCYIYQKTTNKQSWKFFKSEFGKWCLQKAIKFRTLTQLICFIFLLKFIGMLRIYKKFHHIWVGRRLGRVRTKYFLAQTVWKFLFCNLHFEWWFKFLEKVLIWLRNVTSIKKLPIGKVESFFKSKSLTKANMQNSGYTKPLSLKL